ncbi:MAG: serine--tRNA ligase [Microscillaceae bacterium]|nr:serine--tRNA ligase [Microscillaceae bacterium]MDW8461103.1 serine--tRNA ligase [Cytophagales bacterium]
MLQISILKEKKEEVLAALAKRNFTQAQELVEKALELDQKRREMQHTLDKLLAEANSKAKQIGILIKEGKYAEAEELKSQTAQLKQQEKSLQETLRFYETQQHEVLVRIPNIPHKSVKYGKSAEDNEIVYQAGEIPQLPANALPHWELIQKLGIIDFELGNKITGAGFPVYKGKGARLQRALINFFLDQALQAGYTEVQPPYVVNAASGFGTGQLPDKDGQMYFIERDELYLIPTAEVPVTNLYRDVILQEKDLPIKNVSYTPCFRREAGTWGAEVRGLNRLHQFDKVEIVQIVQPEKSYQALEEMVAYVKNLLVHLALPFRILRLCGGDMGFTSALTYDFEVYSAAQKKWLEVSSVSNFETFQANRLKLRYKDAQKKSILLHTLNGSALALPRTLAALLENNQDAEGHIHLPQVLWQYTGFEVI